VKFRRKSADPVESDAEVQAEAPAGDEPAAIGPQDIDDFVEDGYARLDIGSLYLPAADGLELRLQVDESSQEVRAALLASNEGAVELRAFAAPRNGDLWADVRPKIAADFAQRGGTASERDGRWGPELVCQLTVKTPDGQTATQPSRIIGINGPRWMLRATLLGRAAIDESQAHAWEEVIQRTVVSRGSQAMPVGAELPLRVPGGDAVRLSDG